MDSTILLIALAIGIIVGLIVYWANPTSLQDDSTGEPNLLYILLIVLVVVLLVYWFLSANGYEII